MKNNFKKAMRFLNRKNKYLAFFSIVLLIITIGLMLPRGIAYAGAGETVLGWILEIIYPLVYIIFWLLFYIARVIAWLGASVISTNLNPDIMTAVLNSPAVYKGWTIFRDVGNLLFILILLLIAIGTIFRSENYSIKKSLPKFIIVVFLINFSNVIAGLIIDFSNILMYGILKMMCAAGDKACFQDFYSGMMNVVDNFNKQFPFTAMFGGAQAAVGMAIATIYTLIYGLILLALGIFLMIRVAAFAMLIILSPLAYWGQVTPGLKSIYDKWWENLIQYSFFGPIFALLLYISGELSKISITVDTSAIDSVEGLAAMGELYVAVITNIIPLIFLLAIIPITRKLGLAGTDVIMKNTIGLGEKIGMGAAKYAGGATDRWLARGAQDQRQGVRGKLNRARAYLSPGAIKRAWRTKTAEQEHDYDAATGQTRDIHAPKKLGGRETHYKDIAGRNDVARRIKDFATENGDEIVDMFKKATDIRDQQVLLRMGAGQGVSFKMAATQKDAHGVNYTEDAEGYNRFYNEKIKPQMGETEASKLGEDIGDLEEKKGNKGLKNLGYYNNTSSKWETYDYLHGPAITKNGVTKTQKEWHTEEVVKSFKRSNALSTAKEMKASNFVDASGNWNQVGTDTASTLLSPEWKKHIEKIKPEELEKMRDALNRKGAARTQDENELLSEFQSGLRRGTAPGGGGIGGGGGVGGPGGGGRRTRRVREGQRTLETGTAAEEEEEEEGISGGSEAGQKQDINKSNGKPNRFSNENLSDIRKRAREIKEMAYSAEKEESFNDLNAEFKEEIAKISEKDLTAEEKEELDKTYKALTSAYTRKTAEKVNASEPSNVATTAEKEARKEKNTKGNSMPNITLNRDKLKQIKEDAGRLLRNRSKGLSVKKEEIKDLQSYLKEMQSEIEKTGQNNELNKEIKETKAAIKSSDIAIKREDIGTRQMKLFDKAVEIDSGKDSPAKKKEFLKKLGDAYNEVTKEIYSSEDFRDSDIERINSQLRGHLEAMKREINNDIDKAREENIGIIGKDIKEAEQKTIDSIKEKAKKAKRK